MVIENGSPAALDDWLGLRQALWPHHPEAAHRQDIDRQLNDPRRFASFLARGAEARAFGLAEISIRIDHVNGCTTAKVAFLEGIFVQPAARGQGVARALVQAAEGWAARHGCLEFASDTGLSNRKAQSMHVALGFLETERVVFYRKTLS
jgi:aminoglycoside 6'-N-acetyltransferase I